MISKPDLLECLSCGSRRPLDVFDPFCPRCREPMVFAPAGGTGAFHPEAPSAVEAALDFLPLREFRPELSLGEGRTPLLRLDRLAAALGLPPMYAKNETLNPTGSFKDRGTAVAVQKAAELGFRRIGTVSTGNMAASTAAYGARAGLETIVLLKEGTPLASRLAAGVYGPLLFTVKGDYGRLFFESLAIGRRRGVWFMNSIDPLRIEGYKVTAFEVFQQLAGTPPTHVVLPVSAGGHLIGLLRAFEDLERAGLIPRVPVFVGVQAEGCAPLARAFAAGLERYERIGRADTIASAISNPAPAAGNTVLRLIRGRGGLLVAVSDEDMLDAQGRLAAEGLFVQPESAAALAGLVRAARSLSFRADSRIVLVLTGSGLKAMAALDRRPPAAREIDLDGLGEAIGAAPAS